MSTGNQWIDYDLSIVPEDQGSGLIEQPPAELLASFAELEWYDELCADEMVPRSQWKELSEQTWPLHRKQIGPIQSQGQTGACVGFSVAKGVSGTLLRRFGFANYVELSGMSIYDKIGRTVGSGAYIPDGIKYATDVGALPLRGATGADRYDITFPGLTWKWSRPNGWDKVAGMFRITKAAKIQGEEMHVSSGIKGRWAIVGRSQHAIPYCGYRYPDRPYANSWSQNWGDQGIGYDSPRVFANLVGYVILEVEFRPDIPLPLPT